MNLYILRHGIAAERGTPGYANDADRPLTPEGERKLQLVAAAIKALELGFDLILSSPYLRARQTAEVVAARIASSVGASIVRNAMPSEIDGNPLAFFPRARVDVVRRGQVLDRDSERLEKGDLFGRPPRRHASLEDVAELTDDVIVAYRALCLGDQEIARLG